MKVRVVFSGRGYDRAERLPSEIEIADNATLSDALATLRQQMGGESPLPAACLIAVSGQHVGTVDRHDDRSLRDGDELVLIAPVAGG